VNRKYWFVMPFGNECTVMTDLISLTICASVRHRALIVPSSSW